MVFLTVFLLVGVFIYKFSAGGLTVFHNYGVGAEVGLPKAEACVKSQAVAKGARWLGCVSKGWFQESQEVPVMSTLRLSDLY